MDSGKEGMSYKNWLGRRPQRLRCRTRQWRSVAEHVQRSSWQPLQSRQPCRLRVSSPVSTFLSALRRRVYLWLSFLSHPPSCLPTISKCSERRTYLFVSKISISHANRVKNFTESTFKETCPKVSSLLLSSKKPDENKSSETSISKKSMRAPKVCLTVVGRCGNILCQYLYNSITLWIIGKTRRGGGL